MKNLGNLMKQAQEMQQKMADMQAKLSDLEITGVSGGGMVQVTLNGRGDLKRLKIDPSLCNPGEVEVLEDLVTAAVNDGRARVETRVQEQMESLTGGIPLPSGFKLPF